MSKRNAGAIFLAQTEQWACWQWDAGKDAVKGHTITLVVQIARLFKIAVTAVTVGSSSGC